MSRRISVHKKMSEKAMFCKICKDLGESAYVCDSHNIRDLKGKVCCPNVMCKKCGMKGSHFDNECVRGKKDTDLGFSFVKKEVKIKPSTKIEPKSKNLFAIIAESDDEDGPPPANITIRPLNRRYISWTDLDSDDE